MNQLFYSIGKTITLDPTKIRFLPHTHEQHEIFLFLEGDAKYIVEEKTYPLEPGDIIIIRRQELHHIEHNSSTRYERCVLMISPEFFTQYQCTEYKSCFLPSFTGFHTKIAAETVHSSGLYDAFLRYKKYSENYVLDVNSPILISTITEILYLINKINGFSKTEFKRGPVKSVIEYLNTHYTDDISLAQLAAHFYLSKPYLCRAFRKATGITIHEYICRKRLALVKELTAEGNTIGDAASEAGFQDYSCFYRAYVKTYGTSPRNDL